MHLSSFDWWFVHIFTLEFQSIQYLIVSELFWHLIKSKWPLLEDFTQCLPLKKVFNDFDCIMLGVFDMEFCIHHDNVFNSAYMRKKRYVRIHIKTLKGSRSKCNAIVVIRYTQGNTTMFYINELYILANSWSFC